MKIGFCQFAPQLKQLQSNLDTLGEWVQDIQPRSLDILMFPEMCFTGYAFRSREDVMPFVEHDTAGPCLTFCQETAKRLGCWVVAGYPRHDRQTDNLYNSMCVFDRAGNLHHVYDKHFLYETDENWASEGASFASIDIPEFGKVGLGICMDLNPYRFQSSFWLYEFANYHIAQGSRLILCCMAWLRGENASTEQTPSVLSYWIERLRLLENSGVTVAICNRVGDERVGEGDDAEKLSFCGCSCVMRFNPTGIEAAHCGEDEGLYVLEL
ncbi:hypothetical protein RI367_007452 [Sorochytrium milnesiophthora]